MSGMLDNGTLRVEISEIGAELQSIRAADGYEYLWQGDKTYWGGRAPNLFPTVGRLLDGRYTHQGKTYELGLHGFARHANMQVKASQTEACFTLRDSEETRAQYPFAFCYEVLYRLDGNVLHVTYRVTNEGDGPMYFGLGGHPGFFVPMFEGAAFEDYRIRLPKCGETLRVEFSDKGLFVREYDYPLHEGCIDLRHDLFDNDAIVLRNGGDTAILEHKNAEGRAVEVKFPQMPYVGFWHTPKTDAPFVCIEPWQSLPGREGVCEEWSDRPGMVALAPKASYENAWSIRLG